MCKGVAEIENDVLEAVISKAFNGIQLSIISVVWRQTYGEQREECEISLEILEKATGLQKKSIQRQLNKLIKAKVLLVIKDFDNCSSRIIKFNKNYSEWDLTEIKREQRSNVM